MKKSGVFGAVLAGILALSGSPAVPGITAPFCVTASAASKLPAPEGLTATVSGTSVRLTWDETEGADAYRVYMYNKDTGKYEKYKDTKNTAVKLKELGDGKYKFRVAALVKKNGKYKAQTVSAAVSAKISSPAADDAEDKSEETVPERQLFSSSGRINTGLFVFPEPGTDAKTAADAIGLKDPEYSEFYVDRDITFGSCSGSLTMNGARCAAQIITNDSGQYIEAAVVMGKNTTTFAGAYRRVCAALGDPDEDFFLYDYQTYVWYDAPTKICITLMGTDDPTGSITMIDMTCWDKLPDKLRPDGIKVVSGVDGLSV